MIILHLVLLPCIYIQPIRPLCSSLLIHYGTRAENRYVLAKANGEQKKEGGRVPHLRLSCVSKSEGRRARPFPSFCIVLSKKYDLAAKVSPRKLHPHTRLYIDQVRARKNFSFFFLSLFLSCRVAID